MCACAHFVCAIRAPSLAIADRAPAHCPWARVLRFGVRSRDSLHRIREPLRSLRSSSRAISGSVPGVQNPRSLFI